MLPSPSRWRGGLLVTRPGQDGEQLTMQLRGAGLAALWLPAFDLGPPPDAGMARAALAGLSADTVAVFVSPAAARLVAELLPGPWPAQVPIGAVGAATAAQVRALVPGASAAEWIVPGGAEPDGAAGAEAFWAALAARAERVGWPRRLLLLRAASGRDWLLERCAAQGIAAQPVAVYERQPHVPAAPTAAALEELNAAVQAGTAAAALFTSSEAVAVLADQLAPWPALAAAVRKGPNLATHPRIAARLHDAGRPDVRECGNAPAAILAALVGPAATADLEARRLAAGALPASSRPPRG